MKKFRISAFQWYKIFHSNSRNDRDMIKWKKYTPNQKKMLPPINTFFSFDHISVISWVSVENLISLESWYSKLFHDAKFFFVFWRFSNYEFLNKIRVFFSHIKKYHFSSSYQKNICFVKTRSCIDYFAKKFLEKLCSLGCFKVGKYFIFT